MRDWSEVKNVLVVRPDNIGDVIMLGPAVRALKENLPTSRTTLLASPAGSTAASLLPWIDDVITWRPIWQDVGNRLGFDPAREQDFIRTIAARQFDAAIIFTSFNQTPHVAGFVCYLAGIPLRARESKEFGGSTLTHELTSAPVSLHQAERNLRLVESLGFAVRDRQLKVHVDDRSRIESERLLQRSGIDPYRNYIVAHPGASAEARRFSPHRFGETVDLLTAHGWQVLVTGTSREADVVSTVRSIAPDTSCIDGDISLGEFAAIIERATVVICGNTLPLHLADALGTPLVVLYSGTDYEEQWRPRQVASRLLRRSTACSPCYLFECPIGKPCLDIDAEEVVAAVEDILGDCNRPAGSWTFLPAGAGPK